ncbi:MAG: hypothetical protein Q4G34_07030 [Micrococcus sp.]|nr:hypothetical protein [Micrococcus sp.]
MTLPPMGPQHSDSGADRDPRTGRYTGQPTWLRSAFTFMIVLFTCTLIAAFSARAMGFGRGDVGPAIVVFAVGIVAALVVTFFLSRRR